MGEDEDIAVLAGKAARLAAKRAAMLGTLDLCELRTMVEDIAMDIAGGNLALAARLLGCNRSTLYRRVKLRARSGGPGAGGVMPSIVAAGGN